MHYEIRSIEPVLNDRDVLLEIAYWYDELDGAPHRPGRSADFVEHHLVVGIPKPDAMRPRKNNLGQFYGADGILVNRWVEVDGEWVQQPDPVPGDPAFQWETFEDRPEDAIVAIAERRARDVGAFDLRGMTDLYRPQDKPARSQRLGNVANRAAVRALERTRKQVD